ncbi:MAG: hypothetical protein PWQ88_66 [Candidatus Methanomethylophilaceae archaeon]|nr:hypothetical protein [Candidatus Methanomethylophilaceae archaeon]MDI3541793.1 hypothetical protein [Candidatus Methanomethylophilaceae archaeon]
MPLGNPMGEDFVYSDEGLPIGIFMGTVRVSSLEQALTFYRDLLGMEIVKTLVGRAILSCGEQMLMLRESSPELIGGETGLYLATKSIYDLHARLVDEGVIFVQPPLRDEVGLTAIVVDDDGNILTFIEP